MAIIGNKYRRQILFEPEQHDTLKEIAKEEGRSVSHVVREIVQLYLTEQAEDTIHQQRLDAIAKIKKHRTEMLARQDGKPLDIEIIDWVDEIREERDNELLNSGD